MPPSLGNTIIYPQCWKERFKIYKATKFDWKDVHFKQLRRVAKFYRSLYLVGKLVRLYAAAVLLIPRGLCGLGHVVRAHDLTVRGGWFLHRRRGARSSPTPPLSSVLTAHYSGYLTIIPRARMGSESIAHEAEGRMGYWLKGHEGERNNCFSKIQLVGKKISRQNNSSQQNAIQPPLF